MIITPTVTPGAFGQLHLSWNGTIGAVVRVFVNGLLIHGPIAVATAPKTLVVPASDPCTIEVHENSADESVISARWPLERKPLVVWLPVAGAAEYQVYAGSTLLGVVQSEPSATHYRYEVRDDLRIDGGVWTTMHVRAVNARGRESATLSFPVAVPGVLARPTGLTVTGGAGVFNLEVTS